MNEKSLLQNGQGKPSELERLNNQITLPPPSPPVKLTQDADHATTRSHKSKELGDKYME